MTESADIHPTNRSDGLVAAAYPILEFDPSPNALLESTHTAKPIDAPERCVICFFQDVLTSVVQ
jgi:hypothetical protein